MPLLPGTEYEADCGVGSKSLSEATRSAGLISNCWAAGPFDIVVGIDVDFGSGVAADRTTSDGMHSPLGLSLSMDSF